MKEITLRLADNIADGIAREAVDMGVTSEEMIKFILGAYVQSSRYSSTKLLELKDQLVELRSFMSDVSKFSVTMDKEMLKVQARAGALTCKDCTLKLTEQDVEKGKCGSCGALIK